MFKDVIKKNIYIYIGGSKRWDTALRERLNFKFSMECSLRASEIENALPLNRLNLHICALVTIYLLHTTCRLHYYIINFAESEAAVFFILESWKAYALQSSHMIISCLLPCGLHKLNEKRFIGIFTML